MAPSLHSEASARVVSASQNNAVTARIHTVCGHIEKDSVMTTEQAELTVNTFATNARKITQATGGGEVSSSELHEVLADGIDPRRRPGSLADTPRWLAADLEKASDRPRARCGLWSRCAVRFALVVR